MSHFPVGPRPLTGSDAEQRLFVNRVAELGHLERAARLDFNVLVIGERGIGSTSLLRRHQRHLEDAGRSSHYVAAAGIDDLSELVAAIRVAVAVRRAPCAEVHTLCVSRLRMVLKSSYGKVIPIRSET